MSRYVEVAEHAACTCFDRALTAYLYALDRLNNEPDESDEACDYAAFAMRAAQDRLMAVPATNLDQLRAKADAMFFDLNSVVERDHIVSFMSDLVELTGGRQSMTFDPMAWLDLFERRGGSWKFCEGELLFFVPETDLARESMAELEMRGGRAAVESLIIGQIDNKAELAAVSVILENRG